MSPDEVTQETEESIKDVVEITKSFVQAKLQRPSLENQKILAEIAETYAVAEEKLASTAKIRAETKSVELDNALKQLQYALQAIEVIKQVQTFLIEGGQFVIDVSEDRS